MKIKALLLISLLLTNFVTLTQQVSFTRPLNRPQAAAYSLGYFGMGYLVGLSSGIIIMANWYKAMHGDIPKEEYPNTYSGLLGNINDPYHRFNPDAKTNPLTIANTPIKLDEYDKYGFDESYHAGIVLGTLTLGFISLYATYKTVKWSWQWKEFFNNAIDYIKIQCFYKKEKENYEKNSINPSDECTDNSSRK
jgi:hypothetical protein